MKERKPTARVPVLPLKRAKGYSRTIAAFVILAGVGTGLEIACGPTDEAAFSQKGQEWPNPETMAVLYYEPGRARVVTP